MQATELSTIGPNRQVPFTPKAQDTGEHMAILIHIHTRLMPTISLSYLPWSPLTLRIPSPNANPLPIHIPPPLPCQRELLNNHEIFT